MKRREFVKLAAGTALVIMDPANQSPAGPGGVEAALARLSAGSDGKTPTPKNFSAAWVESLTKRGAPKVYTAASSADFKYIGMPVGGIGTGQVYLGATASCGGGTSSTPARRSGPTTSSMRMSSRTTKTTRRTATSTPLLRASPCG